MMSMDFHAAGDSLSRVCVMVDLYVGIDRWDSEEGPHRYPAVQSSRTVTVTGLGIEMHP
jgi:hypothetical protein